MIISNLTAYVPAYAGTKPATRALALANALFAELANYGIVMEADLHQRIAAIPDNQLALTVVRSILDDLTVGADVDLNRALFSNWEDRQYMTVGDCVVQICGYIFQFDGNMLNDPNFTRAIHTNVDFSKVKVLRLASEQEFDRYFNSLVNAKTALDRKHTKRLKYVFSLCSDRLEKLPRIKSAEIRVMAMLELCLSKPLGQVFTALHCQPVDALRFAAALKDFESLKLPSDVMYAKLSWQQRKAILQFWDEQDFEELSEAMGQNRSAWERFFKHIHVFSQEQFQKYNTAFIAAAVSVGSREDFIPQKLRKQVHMKLRSGAIEVTEAGTLAYRTFASRVASAVKAQDTQTILALVSQRPGWAFRNLGTVLGGVPHRQASQFADSLVEFLPKIQIATLLAILGINPDAQWRVIEAKGKTRIEPADYGPVFGFLRDKIIMHLKQRYGFAGRVEVREAALGDRIVPFISRNSELERGSAEEVDTSKGYLYLLMHWIQDRQRTDLDLSLVAFDKDWNHHIVYFGSQADTWLHHSGDFTSAPGPNGATEYGRIDLDKIPADIRYVIPAFNVYGGENFGTCRVCRAGFLASDSQRFQLTQDGTYYDVKADSRLHVPFAYDVRANKITTLNYNQDAGGYGQSIHNYVDDLKKLLAASDASQPVTIADLAEWLSGDAGTTDLVITETPDPENVGEIGSDNLFTLFER